LSGKAPSSGHLATSDGPEERRFPLWPLLATLAVQTLATAAAYSIPAVAPKVAQHLQIPPAWVGFFISTVYGVGIISALFSPRMIHAYGAVRVSQGVLVATLAMLAVAAIGNLPAVALGAALMGLAYGATAPASTHMLVPLTPPSQMNMVLSLRQIGVPLGGVLAGLLMPPLVLIFGWRATLLIELVPVLILLVLLQVVRPHWDKVGASSKATLNTRSEPFRLMRADPALRRLSVAVFVYSGLQLCFIVFMTTQLTTVVGLDLVTAGQMLATYQVAGVVSRPIWGWIADRFLSARRLLVIQSGIMCAAAMMAGHLVHGTPTLLVLLVAVTGGATASGFTGIAYGEFARLGGAKRTEATGLGAAAMFAGVLVLPSLMSLAVLNLGGYEVGYTTIGLLALAAGGLLALPSPRGSVQRS
jgi:predicted MFS family arabinose efflux permease